MSTQRRENRWQRTSCTGSAGAPEQVCSAPDARQVRAYANDGTAPPGISVRLATNSLQSDYRSNRIVRLVRFFSLDIRRGSPPPGAGNRTDTGSPATHGSPPPPIPFPSGFARIHPALPQIPAGIRRWAERYDGKRDLYLQHAA